jgi:hypothetical protein
MACIAHDKIYTHTPLGSPPAIPILLVSLVNESEPFELGRFAFISFGQHLLKEVDGFFLKWLWWNVGRVCWNQFNHIV